ncbi:MAG: DUF3078 domain-containing protein [Muribaculaceae bacterium]|nr:DUF3078 domain-containing protein [Muribaculaceae bacterium]
MKALRLPLIIIALATISVSLRAQKALSPYWPHPVSATDSIPALIETDTTLTLLIDRPDFDSIVAAQRLPRPMLRTYFAPQVFSTVDDSVTVPALIPDDKIGLQPGINLTNNWIADYNNSDELLRYIRHNVIYSHPQIVRYNTRTLPDIPRAYHGFIDPTTSRIVIEEIKVDDRATNFTPEIERRVWLNSFNASLQFSQAYISPNWYQGGNNNLNMIGQLLYSLKLNQRFYPQYLFDLSIGYKLALNSAPDDSIHSHNITEDIFQINATMGLKAARRWFYSANIMFKTQLFNSYPTNSRERKASFLSPGELNVGLGMTYSYVNPKKTFNLGLSISPASWNMKTCLSHKIDPEVYGIDNGRRVKNKIGSSAELTMQWKMAYNIIYSTRLFGFTDYAYAYADWENTIDFNINRFLSTRLYVHFRYDTTTPAVEDSNWRKLQLKEIFSFGFSYHFGV